MNDRIEGELLEKLKAHLINKMREHDKTLDRHFHREDAEDIIESFDGVPTPPENPPGSGTR